jgi:hypothetical protein
VLCEHPADCGLFQCDQGQRFLATVRKFIGAR